MVVVALVVALVALVAAFVASGSAKRYANDRIAEILSHSAAQHTEIVRDIRLILDRQGRADDLIGSLRTQLDATVADITGNSQRNPRSETIEPAAPQRTRKPRKAATGE